MKKIALVGCLALVTALIWAAGGYTLNHFEFWRAFPQIDNVVGMLPVALTVVGLGCLTAILWVAKARRRPVVVVITAFAVLSLGLFPNAVRGNWWLDHSGAGGVEAAVDLSVYAPFTGSQTAVLDIDSGLQLASDLPRLDGATAFYPIYAAIAQAVYAPEAYSPSDVVCTTTLNAFDALIVKDADVIFVLAPSAEQRAKAEAAGVELHFTPIGREAFVFLAGKTNPLDNLTTQQIRNVYSGKTAQWATLGWEEGGQIIAYQRVENSGSQSGLQRMVMAGLPIQAPQPLPKGLPKGSSSMMQQVSVSWQGVQPALGFSYRFFATTMFPNPDAKLLQVDGVAPTVANIQNGSYPFIADFYAVTNGPPQGNTKVLIDWITSPPGQAIVAQAGYTPLTN